MVIWLILINSHSVFLSHPVLFNHCLVSPHFIIALFDSIASQELSLQKRKLLLWCQITCSITLLRHQYTNQNGLKLNVVSHTHSALIILGELKYLYKDTPHFPFIQSLSLLSESCFFVFCLVYRPDPNWTTIQIGSHLSYDTYIGSHSCLVPDTVVNLIADFQ